MARVSFKGCKSDNRGAVVAADPESDGRGRVVDPDAAHIGLCAQKVSMSFARGGRKPQHAVVRHRARPQLVVLSRKMSYRIDKRRRHVPSEPFFHRTDRTSRLCWPHIRQTRCGPAHRAHGAAQPRTRSGRRVNRRLQRPGVHARDHLVAEVHQATDCFSVGGQSWHGKWSGSFGMYLNGSMISYFPLATSRRRITWRPMSLDHTLPSTCAWRGLDYSTAAPRRCRNRGQWKDLERVVLDVEPHQAV